MSGKPSGTIVGSSEDILISLVMCRLFEYFVSIFDELIRDARKEGQFDSGIVDIKAGAIELSSPPKVDVSSHPSSWFVISTC